MAVDFSLTFLGTGTSVGVPVIGCDCAVCTSLDPRNRRTRSSVLVRGGGETLLVDSGPDLRMQALREQLREIDAVLYTHEHLDHVAGFDELRAFCWFREEKLPLYATSGCLQALQRMYGWAFSDSNQQNGYIRPEARLIEGPFVRGGLRITPLPVEHADVQTIGYLFETERRTRVAYLPDVKQVPAPTVELLAGVEVLIVDALRPRPHPTHLSLSDALSLLEKCGPGEAWLTHLGHENDHGALEQSLPPGVHVAYDGLELTL